MRGYLGLEQESAMDLERDTYSCVYLAHKFLCFYLTAFRYLSQIY